MNAVFQEWIVGFAVFSASLVVFMRVMGSLRIRPRKWLAGVLLRRGWVGLAMRVQHGWAGPRKRIPHRGCCDEEGA